MKFVVTKQYIDDLNQDVAHKREFAYSRESDSLFIASQKYAALGETEKAIVTKHEWLKKVAEIDARYPYYDYPEDLPAEEAAGEVVEELTELPEEPAEEIDE